MSVAGNKFNSFVEDVNNGVIDFASDTIKVMLSNTAPVATNSVKADISEISVGNGYSAGGTPITLVSSVQTDGTYRYVGSNVTFTASGGDIGPFKYLVIYDDTPTSPLDPLISWYDIGIDDFILNDGDAATIAFDQTNGILSET